MTTFEMCGQHKFVHIKKFCKISIHEHRKYKRKLKNAQMCSDFDFGAVCQEITLLLAKQLYKPLGLLQMCSDFDFRVICEKIILLLAMKLQISQKY